MSRKITADDLKPGQFVIVEEWLDEALAPSPDGDDRPYWMRNPKLRKPVGDPMQVLAVALPFFTVRLCQGDQPRGVLDTRQVKLQEVKLDYVRSLIPSYGRKTKKAGPPAPSKQRYDPATQQWRTVPEEPR